MHPVHTLTHFKIHFTISCLVVSLIKISRPKFCTNFPHFPFVSHEVHSSSSSSSSSSSHHLNIMWYRVQTEANQYVSGPLTCTGPFQGPGRGHSSVLEMPWNITAIWKKLDRGFSRFVNNPKNIRDLPITSSKGERNVSKLPTLFNKATGKTELFFYSLYRKYYKIVIIWRGDQRVCSQAKKVGKRYYRSVSGS
jgi:hypothetical protein